MRCNQPTLSFISHMLHHLSFTIQSTLSSFITGMTNHILHHVPYPASWPVEVTSESWTPFFQLLGDLSATWGFFAHKMMAGTARSPWSPSHFTHGCADSESLSEFQRLGGDLHVHDAPATCRNESSGVLMVSASAWRCASYCRSKFWHVQKTPIPHFTRGLIVEYQRCGG